MSRPVIRGFVETKMAEEEEGATKQTTRGLHAIRRAYRLSSQARRSREKGSFYSRRNERNGLTQWGRLQRIPGNLSLSIVDRKWPAISFTFAVFQESRINFMLVQLPGRILPSFGSFP